jgi:hypothetical protein
MKLTPKVINIDNKGIIIPENNDKNSLREKFAVMFKNILKGKDKFKTILEKTSAVRLVNHCL